MRSTLLGPGSEDGTFAFPNFESSKYANRWDVYLIYPPDHSWDAEIPPAPEFWMHQLDEDLTLLLDPLRLKQKMRALIEQSFLDM